MGSESVLANDRRGKQLPIPRDALLELPPSLETRIAEVARGLPGSATVDVAAAVSETSRAYTQERGRLTKVATQTASHVARLRFFLPRDLPKAMDVLRDLDARGRLPRRETLRVLDLGAGLGTTTLSLARYAHVAGLASKLRVRAVDVDAAALAIAAKVARSLEGFADLELETRTGDLRKIAAAPEGPWDLVLIGLALNELGEDANARASLLGSLVGALAEDGVVVVIEPALRETSRALMAVRDVVAASGLATIEAPCLGTGPCPMLASGERDWCHVELPGELSGSVAALAREAGLRDDAPTYARLALSRPTRASAEVPEGALRLVSAPLGSKGRTELHACGASGSVRLVELDRDAREHRHPLGSLRRGALVTVEGATPKGDGLRLGAEARLEVVVD
ncbi:MAG: small ribosomal subunit Rsm22 family protein [Polyangiales bacterium]